MFKTIVLTVALFGSSSVFAMDIAPGTPGATAYTLAKATLASKISSDHLEKVFFSTDLLGFMKKMTQTQWRNFDADVITGTQDLSALTIADVRVSGTIATVVYRINPKLTLVVDYVMIRQGDNWKVNDVVYHDGKTESFRQMAPRLSKDQ